MRKAKAQKNVYTFTVEQLREHDLFVVDQMRDKLKRDITEQIEEDFAAKEKHMREVVEKEWADREAEFKSGDQEEQFFTLLQYLLSVPSRVLIEHFKWTPDRPDHFDRRLKINRFADLLCEEIRKICDDETMDIRRYCEETYQKYGIQFMKKEVDDE